jgi:transcriptional regulator GlxA family with amidase domain
LISGSSAGYTACMAKMRDILLIVPDGGALFEPAGIADILNQANLSAPQGTMLYKTVIASVGQSKVIRGKEDLSLLSNVCLSELDIKRRWDTVFVMNKTSDSLEFNAAADWIAQAYQYSRRTVSVCAGALILARAGLLAGRKATTHWRYFNALSELSPTTEIDRNSIFVRDGNIWTSAGASSGFDLALALVADDMGSDTARIVAKELVMYLRRPGGQAQFSRYLASQADPDTTVGRVQSWALEHLNQDLSVEALADHAAMSPRNFFRTFSRETGTTPARFIEDIRLEAARIRLEQGHESLDEIASACGLGSALTLRRIFEKQLGVSPSDYRLRFGMI